MKKLNFLAICFMAICSFTQAQTYQNTTATTPVDGITRLGACGVNTQPGVHMSEITVPLTGAIVDPTKITFKLSLNSAWLGDLAADIITPSGDAITLIRRIGATLNESCGDSSAFIAANILSFNAANTIIIDAAVVPDAQPIPAGNYLPTLSAAKYPTHNPANMTTFLNGKTLNGNWRLVIYDYGQGDASTINSWQIVVGAGATMKTKDSGVFGSDISLKQNPVQDQLLLNVKDDFKTLFLEIFDASGKMVKNENLLSNSKNPQVDVRTLSPGIYLLIPVKDGERQQTIKFIKK